MCGECPSDEDRRDGRERRGGVALVKFTLVMAIISMLFNAMLFMVVISHMATYAIDTKPPEPVEVVQVKK